MNTFNPYVSAPDHMFGVPNISYWYNSLDVHPDNVRDLITDILSDAQELMSMREYTAANHRINRAKWIIQHKLS